MLMLNLSNRFADVKIAEKIVNTTLASTGLEMLKCNLKNAKVRVLKESKKIRTEWKSTTRFQKWDT